MKNYWDKEIKKIDKKGYAPIYKEMTKQFFTKLKATIFELNVDRIKGVDDLNIENVEYLDGYFLFAMGTNSVVHFKIKECPGWLFGIWWREPTLVGKRPKTYEMKGQFFAQYEEIIDKFKPSASQILSELCAYKTKRSESCDWQLDYIEEVSDIIRFIIKEPALAFCRDYCGWNYNTSFHDRRSAKKKFEDWKQWNTTRKTYTKICDDKVLAFIKERVLPLYGETAQIVDRGENWCPRYQIISKLTEGDCMRRPGYYDSDAEEFPAAVEEFEALELECKELSNQYEFYWHCPVNLDCLFLKEDIYENYLNGRVEL